MHPAVAEDRDPMCPLGHSRQVAEQLSRCVDEVKFVALERPLLDDESCCLVVLEVGSGTRWRDYYRDTIL